ncbi:MAG: hypothetical protein KDC83_04895 [Flavobacteriales bacterium]|nr:hypothetical protein [Flavobacteriales bacterium]
MKYITLILVLFVTSTGLHSKEKIIDKSGKEPKWVNALQKGYIITSAKDNDIESAKAKCILRVKEQIVNSISENVRSKTEVSTSEETVNKQISTFLENYASTTTGQTGKTDFVQGISITKVEDFYWEKIQDTDTKKSWVIYHIKYPFSQEEMDELVASYKMKDVELSFQLNKVISNIPEMTSVEEISAGISQLNSLKSSFVDLRQDQAKAGVSELTSMLDNMEFVVVSHKVGQLEYVLQYQGRTMTYGKSPKVSSECATINNVKVVEDRVLITYNADYCIAQDPNNGIDVIYKVGSQKISNRFRFDASDGKVQLDVKDRISIKKGEPNTIEINLISKFDNPFTVTKIELDLTGAGLSVSNLSSKFNGKGAHLLKIESNQKIDFPDQGVTSGTIHYKSDKTGEMGRQRFYNAPYSVK